MPDVPEIPAYIREQGAELPYAVADPVDALRAIVPRVCEEGFHVVDPGLVEAAQQALAATIHHGEAAQHFHDFLYADGPRSPNDLMDAVQIWIDTAAPAWGGRLAAGDERVYSFLIADGDTGQTIDPSNASEEQLWAGRVITARLSDDREMFTALYDNLADNDDVETLVYGAMAVLHICGEALRGAH